MMDAKPDWIDQMAADLRDARAEVERLRVEVDYWKDCVSGANHQRDAAIARAALARNEAINEAADKARKHPMRFAGQTEEYVRFEISEAILTLRQSAATTCPCTLIEQDDDCPIGQPSLLCGVCSGTGNTTADKVQALAAEMLRIASDLGEPQDPFAAWENLQGDDAQAEIDRLNAELKAERALADDLYIGSRGCASQVTSAWAAYRKARGV